MTIEVSKCCQADVKEDFKDSIKNPDEPIAIYVCTKCNTECEVEEVCEDCRGTGWVVQGEFDDITEVRCHCRNDDGDGSEE